MLATGLMLFAPLISRVLVAFSVMPAMTMADCTAMPSMAQHQADHTVGTQGRGAPQNPAPPSTDACGYCSLLFHTPVLAVTVPVLPPVLSPALAPLQARVFSIPAVHLPAQRSRGPPLA